MIAALFTYALTAAGTLLGLVVPYYGLLTYIALSVLRPTDLWGVPAGNYSRIVALAVIVGWILQGCGSFHFARAKVIFWLLCGYPAWTAVSTLFARYPDAAWDTLEDRLKIILPVAIGLTLVRTTLQMKQLAWVLVLSQATIAAAGHVSIHLLGGANWLFTEGLGGYDNNDTAAGMVLLTGVAFGLGISQTVTYRKWLALGCSGLIANAAVLSYSRGALLGLLVVGMSTLLIIGKQREFRWVLLLALLAAIRITGPYAQERFLQIFQSGRDARADSSAENRVLIWKVGWDWMQDHPIVGIGPGNFQRMTVPYFGRERAAHSLWISTGSELGYPGLAILAGVFATTLWEARKLLHTQAVGPFDRWNRDVGRMALLGLPGFLASATFLSISGLEQAYFVTLLVAGSVLLAAQPTAVFVPPPEPSLAANSAALRATYPPRGMPGPPSLLPTIR
jgi:probable O-glycosylation ligase (exosortase A-associated)